MNDLLPMAEEASFNEISHQGKTIRVGDEIIIREAGETRTATVSSIVQRQGHYWVGYDDNAKFYPWPLVQKK